MLNTKSLQQATLSTSTEEKIIDAARKVFFQQGFNGARMRDIATEADINISMLHYYYRSKEHLFEIIFTEALDQVYYNILKVLEEDLSIIEKLQSIVENCLEFYSKHPEMLQFLFNEIAIRKNIQNLSPDRLETITKLFYDAERQINFAVTQKLIRPISSLHLALHILSLCTFPYLTKPITTRILSFTEEEYDVLLFERKKEIVSFILHAIGYQS